jgi:mono/diheme cytochrome c family protein
MVKFGLWVVLCLLPIVSYADQGRQLHDGACIQCHASLTGGKPNSLYTRGDKMVRNKAALNKQVDNCAIAAGVSWNSTQKAAVVNYLSKQFYKF